MIVPKNRYEVVYNGKNITGDILPYVIRFTYSDRANGEADELELLLEDTDGLWQSDWYPLKGDTISAKIYDETGRALDCGTFTVDEIKGRGTKAEGETLSIKAIAAGINKKIRTKCSYAHEKKTLREIANTIASKHGLTVTGNIADIRIDRVTQYRQTDLKFLQRLAYEYGYSFSVRDKLLVFTNVFELESKTEALTIYRNECTSFEVTDKTANTYKGVKVAYHNPRQKKIISHEQSETDATHETVKADNLEVRVRAENQQQAEIKGRVALYRANSLQQEGNVEMPGNVLALAGNNCEVVDRGMFSGKYYIFSSTHSVSKDSGYTTRLEIKRIGLAQKEIAEMQKREEKKRNKATDY